MQMSPEFKKAQENMMAGVITSEGFLGDDKRPIIDIIEHDEEELKKLGLEVDKVCEDLRRLMEAGRRGLGMPITIEKKWLVQVDEIRGFLASPFEDGIYKKINVVITKLQDGKETTDRLIYSELGLHLMEKYHFFQGKGSPYRMEPAMIKTVLGEQ